MTIIIFTIVEKQNYFIRSVAKTLLCKFSNFFFTLKINITKQDHSCSKKRDVGNFSIFFAYIIVLFFFLCTDVYASDKKTLRVNLETATQIALTNYYLLLSLKNKNTAIKELISERWRDLLPTLGVNMTRQKYIIEHSNDYVYNAILVNLEQIVYDGERKSLILILLSWRKH